MSYGDYLEYKQGEDYVSHAVSLIKPLKPNMLVVTGLSGIVVGCQVARILKIPLWIIRKGRDYSHGSRIERPSPLPKAFRYVILDDFIASGKTIRRILKAMRGYDKTVNGWEIKDEFVPIGIVLYDRSPYSEYTDEFFYKRKRIPIFD